MKDNLIVVDGNIVTRETHRFVAKDMPYLLGILNAASQKGEWRAVRRVLNLVKRGGFSIIGLWDGETMETPKTTEAALGIVFNLDEISVRVNRDPNGDPEWGKGTHGILLVLGNASDGSEVVSDWNYTDGDADGFNALMDKITEAM